MKIKNVTGSDIYLPDVITEQTEPYTGIGAPGLEKTIIQAGNTIDLLLYNTPGRIYSSFSLLEQIADGNIVVICDETELSTADSVKHFSLLGLPCSINEITIPPGDLPSPLPIGKIEYNEDNIFQDTITADTNDYNPIFLDDAYIIKLTPSANWDLTGISAPASGYKALIILNDSPSKNLFIRSNNVGSAAANRFLFGTDIQLKPSAAAELFYDQASARWRCNSKHTY